MTFFERLPFPSFETLPLPLKPVDFEFSKVRDMAFNDLVNSFRIPKALFLSDVDAGRVEELRRDILDQRIKKLSDELLGSILGGPQGHIDYSQICTTPSPAATTQEPVTLKKLRDIISKIPKCEAPASYRLVSSNLMAERRQFRFPKSKKKRIRKKWSKREANYRYEPMKQYYIINDTIYAHPSVIKKIKEGILTMSPNGLVEDQV